MKYFNDLFLRQNVLPSLEHFPALTEAQSQFRPGFSRHTDFEGYETAVVLKTRPDWRLEDSSARLEARRPRINPRLENPLKLRLKSIFLLKKKKSDIKLCSFFVQMQFLTKGIFIKRGFSYHFIYICIFVPCDLFLIAFIAGRFVFHFPHDLHQHIFAV